MRIRTVKPEFWKNEHIATLDDFTQLLALGLLNYADDEGYFNANPKLIQADIFPLRDVSRIIPVSVTNLSKLGYLKLYESDDGRIYGHIVNFLNHQVINKPKPSKIKPLCVREQGTMDLSGSTTVVVPGGTGNREQGKEQGKEPPTGSRGEDTPPKKESKPKADKTPSQIRAEALFNKRQSTPWDRAEMTAWKQAKPVVEATSEEDWLALEWWFAKPADKAPFRRKAFAQLLNNWAGEITRAKEEKAKEPRFEL